ncbi:MAG: hypothetical protein GX866_04235 [Firmicutes bacterium]|nr:hypothetical protein [Bacillota bacterium]
MSLYLWLIFKEIPAVMVCIEVQVINAGSNVAKNVRVTVPLLVNDSAYCQYNDFKRTSHDYAISGSMATFNLGDIVPGDADTILIHYDITVYPVKVLPAREIMSKSYSAFHNLPAVEIVALALYRRDST